MDLPPPRIVSWRAGALAPIELRWASRLGPTFVPVDEDEVPRFDLPQIAAVPFETVEKLQSWLLVEAWWRGILDPDRLVQMFGEQPVVTFDLALQDPEYVLRAWLQLRPSELDGVVRWGAEVLRGSGADGVVCDAPWFVSYLGSTAGLRRVGHQEPPGDVVMLSETEPPPPPAPPEPPPRPVKPKPPRPAADLVLLPPRGALFDAFGLWCSAATLETPKIFDSPLELRRQLLLDGLDDGFLRYENLLLAFRAIDVELDRDEVREQLVDFADRIEIHPELAVLATAGRRQRLREAGHDGVTFRHGDQVVALPHYYLRGLRGGLWRRICQGE